MLPLDLAELERAAGDLDAAVARTPGIDTFCSSSAWGLSAHRALMPPRELVCRRGEHGWVVLARRLHDVGWSALEPLEAGWLLGCPFAFDGDPRDLAREFAAECARSFPRDLLFLSGVAPLSPLFDALVEALEDRYELDTTTIPFTRRFRADLTGGVDGFLSRRTPRFRANLRQAERRAARLGVRFEPLAVTGEREAEALLSRAVALEAKSWKGRGGDGLAVPEMAEFYRLMLPGLARRGALRAQVGVHEGRDVAVIFGANIATPEGLTHRGLQFSFDDDYRACSLGNLAQLAQLTALSAEGVALYDLGSEVEYKQRWGELCLETATIVGVPQALRGPVDSDDSLRVDC